MAMSWRVFPGLREGDWRGKLLAIAQVIIGAIALLGIIGMVTQQPLLLLGFASAQGLIIIGIVLFAIVAISSQRSLIEERFRPGDVIFREGDPGRDVYVLKSGNVEVLMRRPDATQEVIKTLGPGDHFGEMALLGDAPRNATIRAVNAVRVYRMGRNSFAALYTNLPGMKEHFNKAVETRLRELETRK
jgi:CRP-like cAMP-binding protein